jgi:hypothetical protein
MATEAPSTPEEHAAKRVKDYTDLMWHVASYVIINVFLWLSVPYVAYWVTIAWGIGLAFHVADYFIEDHGRRNRRYQAFLAQEQAREKHDSTQATGQDRRRRRRSEGDPETPHYRRSHGA